MLCTGHAGRYPQELKVTIKPRVSARVRCGVGAFALAGEKGWDSLGERAIVKHLGGASTAQTFCVTGDFILHSAWSGGWKLICLLVALVPAARMPSTTRHVLGAFTRPSDFPSARRMFELEIRTCSSHIITHDMWVLSH